ncbi:hypothetical protein Q9Q99_19120 [Curtobacterium flaccumfaciens]|nr:hypothetical protein Q9Q99_19120 [Curtobacterium flaccumfaciens]
MSGADDAPRSDHRRGGPIRPLRLLSLRARITIGSDGDRGDRDPAARPGDAVPGGERRRECDPHAARRRCRPLRRHARGRQRPRPVVTGQRAARRRRVPVRRDRALDDAGPRPSRRSAVCRSTPAGTSIITASGSEYRVVVEHPVNEAGRWTVVAARNSQAEAIVVDDLTTTLSLTGLAILLAFGVASWVLATTALRPVNRMRREAERLSVAPERAGTAGGPRPGRAGIPGDDAQRLPGPDPAGDRA